MLAECQGGSRTSVPASVVHAVATSWTAEVDWVVHELPPPLLLLLLVVVVVVVVLMRRRKINAGEQWT